ncbi:hypothetical protein [Methyloferula stellata]|uniref:hypothetical protein n=1 Tax=Methyloferula stellata TaxID=876270 RepID=UPI00047A159D|nr:hypothetical protein [Methyloferula stellata]
MILGMSLSAFTTFHVVLSLIGIASGLIVLAAMIDNKRAPAWTALFLVTTIATSVTGFLFPFKTFDPALVVGTISLVLLVIAVLSLYALRLAGIWRPVYVVAAVMALYLNAFVGVVQSFQKLAFLKPLAPTQSEPPFAIAQGAVLILFVLLGFLALRRFHPPIKPA